LQDVQQLAAWLPCHGSILRSLHLADWLGAAALFTKFDEQANWPAALSTLTAAFAAAAAAAGASWRLASLSVPDSTGTASAAALLQTLPAGSLTYLACDLHWANTADMAALCSLTALRHLHLNKRYHHYGAEDDAVALGRVMTGQSHKHLVPLSVLQQLTCLELCTASSVQLQHLQLPRLQHLMIYNLVNNVPAAPRLLGNMSSLAVLGVRGASGLSAADQLPPNSRMPKLQFEPRTFWDLSHLSFAPLLNLSRLEQLHLQLHLQLSWRRRVDRTLPAADEIAQLSTLRSLQEVRFLWDSENSCQQGPRSSSSTATAQAFAAALQGLPLRALSWRHERLPAAVLQLMKMLQGLTALTLHSVDDYLRGEQEGVTVAQLASLLRRLTTLQCLHLQGETVAAGIGQSKEALDDSNAIRELLQAICSLRHLSAVGVRLCVKLPDAAVTQLNSSLPQLLCGPVAQSCTVGVRYDLPGLRSPVLHIIACDKE
jgi:hypothetical protein